MFRVLLGDFWVHLRGFGAPFWCILRAAPSLLQKCFERGLALNDGSDLLKLKLHAQLGQICRASNELKAAVKHVEVELELAQQLKLIQVQSFSPSLFFLTFSYFSFGSFGARPPQVASYVLFFGPLATPPYPPSPPHFTTLDGPWMGGRAGQGRRGRGDGYLGIVRQRFHFLGPIAATKYPAYLSHYGRWSSCVM